MLEFSSTMLPAPAPYPVFAISEVVEHSTLTIASLHQQTTERAY